MLKNLCFVGAVAVSLFCVQDFYGLTRSDHSDLMLLSGAQANCGVTSVNCAPCTVPTCTPNTYGSFTFCSKTGGVDGCSGMHMDCQHYGGCGAACTCGPKLIATCPGFTGGACTGRCVLTNENCACYC